jgi:hypothetical protein
MKKFGKTLVLNSETVRNLEGVAAAEAFSVVPPCHGTLQNNSICVGTCGPSCVPSCLGVDGCGV